MKKPLLSLLAATCAFAASAQLDGDGYYRVQSQPSSRICYLLDNHGSNSGTSVDCSAVELYLDYDKCLSDPASVFYIKKVGSQYDLLAQGYSAYQMVNQYLNIDYRNNAYYAYGVDSGFTKYLGDNSTNLTKEHTYMTDSPYHDNTIDMRKWNILPVSEGSDCYLGVKATVNADGAYYASWYASFPYGLTGDMEAFYISKVDSKYGLAVYEPINGTVVPEGTPVIIKCVNANHADNKVIVGASGANSVSGNNLVGVYFDSTRTGHYSATANDKNTMRHLGLTSDGKVGFITISDDVCPRNAGYLKVPSGSPAEFTMVTPAEYEALTADVYPESISISPSSLSLVLGETYTLTATVLPENTTDKTVTWASSNPSVASVDANGKVTALAEGTFTITATCQEVSASIDGEVGPVVATAVYLNYYENTIEVETSFGLNATVKPDNTTYPDVTWTSSDTDIATVDENGRVVGRNAGVATITATCQSVSASCEVTVVKRQQVITWDQEFGEVSEGDVITLTAENTVSWGVNYRLDKGEGSISGNVLTITGSGEYQVTAYHEGNYKFEDAEEVTKVFNVTAGLSSVLADGISFSGTTIINSMNAHIEVYNILGSMIYSGSESSIDLRPGLYLVRTPGSTAKVKLQ